MENKDNITKKPKDDEYAELLSTLKDDESLTWREKCDTVINWRRENRKFLSVGKPFIISGRNRHLTGEELAKAWFMLMYSESIGKRDEFGTMVELDDRVPKNTVALNPEICYNIKHKRKPIQ